MTRKDEPITFFTGSSVVWGAELSLMSIAAHSSHEVRLVTSNVELAQRWDATVRWPSEPVAARAGRVTRLLGFIRRATQSAWRGEIVVVFDFYLLPLFVLLKPIFMLRRGLLVVDVHDAVDGHARRIPYFFLMRYTDLAICISEYIARQVRHQRKVVVYRPVESPTLGGVRPPGVVGIVGQISPEKGTEHAVRAACSASAVTRVLLRGSAAPEHQGYLEQVLRTGRSLLGNSFLFEGRVPPTAVMEGIDVLVATNSHEPFGRVAVEAQLVGAVVVGPNTGGIAEVVDDGVTGYSYSSDDRSTLVGAIERAVRAPVSLRDAAREVARQSFDPQSQAQDYVRNILGY